MTMRVPPSSMDLERAILCSALIDVTTLDLVGDLESKHFYSAANGEIWRAIQRVRARGMSPDHVTVRDDLVAHGKLDAVGGDAALYDITSRLVTTGEPDKHAAEVIALYQRRAVIQVCHEMGAKGYDRAHETIPYLEEVQAEVFRATAVQRPGEGLTRLDPLPFLRSVEAVSRGELAPMGAPTSLDALDERLRGYFDDCLYILAGRPGMGKTALALGSVRAVAKSGKLAAFFSAEMPKNHIVDRYIALHGVPAEAIKRRVFTVDQMRKVGQACAELDALPILIDDTARITVPAMRAGLRRAVAQSKVPLGLIVVDHIGIVSSGVRTDSREQEVSEIARGLKVLAKEFHAPVLALCQLNRECEKSAEKRPSLHHLRDSGEVEQSADVVMFVYRRGYYAAEKKAGRLQEDRFSKSTIEADDDDGRAEIIIAKFREGAPGTVHVMFEGECTRFVDYGHDAYRPEANTRGWET